MALGDNLKKKKLIPDSEDESPKAVKKTVKKKTVSKKSTASEKKRQSPSKRSSVSAAQNNPQTKKTIEKQPVVEEIEQSDPPKKEVMAVEESVASASPELPMYIANELIERKRALKDKYKEEVNALRGKPVQFIVLTIGGEQYALDIDNVKEVVPLPSISKTPNTPEHIKGIVNVRGNNYVVFDLSSKFKIVGDEFPRYLLILKDSELKTSIPLSNLPITFRTNGDMISLSLQLIEDALLDASYIKGLIQDNDDLIYYLDIIELMKNDKAIVVPDKLLSTEDE